MQSAIGWKSTKIPGLLHLGTKVMKVDFKVPKKTLMFLRIQPNQAIIFPLYQKSVRRAQHSTLHGLDFSPIWTVLKERGFPSGLPNLV